MFTIVEREQRGTRREQGTAQSSMQDYRVRIDCRIRISHPLSTRWQEYLFHEIAGLLQHPHPHTIDAWLSSAQVPYKVASF